MYSSLQQQCLVELGITPFDLNDKYKAILCDETDNQSETHFDKTDETSLSAQASQTAPLYVKATPIKAAQAEAVQAESAPSVPKQATVINIEDHWLNCTDKFITDIKAVFPNIIFSVLAFDAKVAQLQDMDGKKVYWKIASKYVAQYVQQETIGQDTLITSPLPSELTPAQKKELWLLIQPYSNQAVADNETTISNVSAN